MPTLLEHARYIRAALDAAESEGYMIVVTTDDDLDNAIEIHDSNDYNTVWES